MCTALCTYLLFFFNAPPPTDIYTLSLHDALPIFERLAGRVRPQRLGLHALPVVGERVQAESRSEEHTSELQSHSDLVCRLLLEKKNKLHEALFWLETRFAFGLATRVNLSALSGHE